MVTKELLNMVFAEAADNVNPSGFRSTSWPRTRMRRSFDAELYDCRMLSAMRSLELYICVATFVADVVTL